MYSKQFNPFCVGESHKLSTKGDNRFPYQNERMGQNEMMLHRHGQELMKYGGGPAGGGGGGGCNNRNMRRSTSLSRQNDNMNYQGGANNLMGGEYVSPRMSYGGDQRPMSFELPTYPLSSLTGNSQASSFPGAANLNPFQGMPSQSSTVGNIPFQNNNMYFPTIPTMSYESAYGNGGELNGNGMPSRLAGGGEMTNHNMQYGQGETQNATGPAGSNTNRRAAGSNAYGNSNAHRRSNSPGSFSGSSAQMRCQNAYQNMPANYDNYNRQPISPTEFPTNTMSVPPLKSSPPSGIQIFNGTPSEYMEMYYGANSNRLTGGGTPMAGQQQQQQLHQQLQQQVQQHQQQQQQQQQQQLQQIQQQLQQYQQQQHQQHPQSYGYEKNSHPLSHQY